MLGAHGDIVPSGRPGTDIITQQPTFEPIQTFTHIQLKLPFMTLLYKSLRSSHYRSFRRPATNLKFYSRTFSRLTPRFVNMAAIPNLKLNDGKEIPVVRQ